MSLLTWLRSRPGAGRPSYTPGVCLSCEHGSHDACVAGFTAVRCWCGCDCSIHGWNEIERRDAANEPYAALLEAATGLITYARLSRLPLTHTAHPLAALRAALKELAIDGCEGVTR